VCAAARAAGGWATTELGRRRFLPALLYTGRGYPQSKMREESERQAFNHLVQGTSAEDMKRGMLAVWPRAGEFEPLLQIHDELIGQCRDASIVPELAAAMQAERGGVMLKTEWGTGTNWSELK
jgi:DNA polymerase I-like protein with 3'-5' exonuclease and polymerase domains